MLINAASRDLAVAAKPAYHRNRALVGGGHTTRLTQLLEDQFDAFMDGRSQ